jgi:hypothetical protein
MREKTGIVCVVKNEGLPHHELLGSNDWDRYLEKPNGTVSCDARNDPV